MRSLLASLLVCTISTAFAASAHGEPSFPYKASVVTDDVYVRSGPGQNYYPTDKLKRGQEVEVYRHDPGGWCAVRPVEGSFTWVSGRFLKPTDNHLAVITEENVSARVGSRFSDVRDVIQVRLRKGEVVEILEAPRGAGPSAWFKIAPPSGEFRWVSAKFLDPDYPRDGIRKNADGSETRIAPSDSEDVSPTGRRDPNVGSGSLGARSGKQRSLSAEEFEKELERVDLELSVMVIEDPRVWSFDSLRERSNMLLDQAQTAVERGRARLLANKIARFDDIKQRQDAVLAMRDNVDRRTQTLARLRPGESDENAKYEIDDRFDGVGRLTQVVSPKAGAPRYALADKDGSVRCYVTPAPGVNLHYFVGRDVGVNGTRGFMPEQRTSHIMARHVTPLESNTRVR